MNEGEILKLAGIIIVSMIIIGFIATIACNRYVIQPKHQSEALERIADSLESIDQKLAP